MAIRCFVVALVGASIRCAPIVEDDDDVVDACVGVMIVADEAVSDAAFRDLFNEVNVTFSGCRADRTTITCAADSVDIDSCRQQRLPLIAPMLAKHGVTAQADCTSLCEVE